MRLFVAGAAPHMTLSTDDKCFFVTAGCDAKNSSREGTTNKTVGWNIQKFSVLFAEMLSVKFLHWHRLWTGVTAHLISKIT